MTGSMKGIDDVSNFDNVPVPYTRPVKTHSFSETDLFEVNKKAVYVFDRETVRVSVNRKYAFLTEKLYNFLESSSSFSFKEFLDYFKVETFLANNVIGILLANNVVIKK